MKFKYLLRGLGIGLAFMAIIWAAGGKQQATMSDEEIMNRARELGMVESGSIMLSDLKTKDEEETTAETAEEIIEEPSEPEEVTAEEPQEITAEEPEEVAVEEVVEESSEEVVEENVEEALVEATEETTSENITITVKSGSGSESVSRLLKDAGLVADAKAFDKFLCDNNYSKSIRVGTFKIPAGSSEEEIAKIITGKH